MHAASAAGAPKTTAQISTSTFLLIFVVATGLKLLLLPAYRSTDFEVHRNWLAITGTLPVSQWYLEETSEWTLDYPPFFAWFECLLAQGAPLFDRGMLTISATPYASAATVAYQRLTVIGTDALLFVGARRLVLAEGGGPGGGAAAALALCCLDAGLLLVDHVHFQYNGMMAGLLLLSVAELRAGHAVRGGVLFAVLLQLKHLFLFAAPLYFVFLLRSFVIAPADGRRGAGAALVRLAALGAPVALVFAVSLGPFVRLGQLGQLASRLFPFGRGLTHAYWAPNTWALYTAADKVLGLALRRGGSGGGGDSAASGLVGETMLLCLPQVRPSHCAVLVLLLQAPVLWRTWCRPRAEAMAAAAACCGLAAFLTGWHVHEKALLPPLLLLAPLRPASLPSAQLHARLLLLLSSAAHYALLPLLYRPTEYVLARAALLLHAAAATVALRTRLHRLGAPPTAPLGLRAHEAAYLAGFALLETFCAALHPALVAPRLAFLPLLCTSVYCALGVHYCFGLALAFWWRSSEEAHGLKTA